MYRPSLLLFLALITLTVKAVPSVASTANLNLSIGTNPNRSPAEDQPSVALDLFWGGDNWSVLFNPYFSGSWDKDEDAFGGEALTVDYEAGVGLSRVWNVGSFHPHVGGGVGHLWRRSYREEDPMLTERASASHSDTGLWASGGVFHHFSSGLSIGTTIRLSGLASPGSHLGGTHVGLTIGWGWPSP
jgi:hypothetical protein